jgi:RNA polymerase sigma factor (sigma-70 family)
MGDTGTTDGMGTAAEGELLARARAGDDAAFAELYRRHAAAVRRYARLCCRDPHTADDLTAEVFARALRVVRSGGGPRSSVRGYLLTMVRHQAAEWGAGDRREQPVPDPVGAAGEPPAEGQEARLADRSMVVRAFRSLPPRWQEVLWHTAVEDEPVHRVAPRLGLTANATAVLAFRAREGLRAAYLQAHVSESLTAGRTECGRYAGRLGTYTRKPSRRHGFRQLRRHLAGCPRCRAAYLELVDLNATLRGVFWPAGLAGVAAGAARLAGAGGAGAGEAAAGLGASGLAGATTGLSGFAGLSGLAGVSGGLLGKAALTATAALAAGAVVTGSVPGVGSGERDPVPAVTAVADPPPGGAGPLPSVGPAPSPAPSPAPHVAGGHTGDAAAGSSAGGTAGDGRPSGTPTASPNGPEPAGPDVPEQAANDGAAAEAGRPAATPDTGRAAREAAAGNANENATENASGNAVENAAGDARGNANERARENANDNAGGAPRADAGENASGNAPGGGPGRENADRAGRAPEGTPDGAPAAPAGPPAPAR